MPNQPSWLKVPLMLMEILAELRAIRALTESAVTNIPDPHTVRGKMAVRTSMERIRL